MRHLTAFIHSALDLFACLGSGFNLNSGSVSPRLIQLRKLLERSIAYLGSPKSVRRTGLIRVKNGEKGETRPRVMKIETKEIKA